MLNLIPTYVCIYSSTVVPSCTYMDKIARCEVIPVAELLMFVVTLTVICENPMDGHIRYGSENEPVISVPSSFIVLDVLVCNTI